MLQPCPYGGKCIDPGYYTDCKVNSRCINFNSTKEKIEFDNLPDLFVVRGQGVEIKFKNKSQLKFFLTDYKGEWKVYVLIKEVKVEIPVDLNKLFN